MRTFIILFLSVFMSSIGLAQSIVQTQEETRLITIQTEKPESLTANYNLATYYYNNAVEMLNAQASGALEGVDGIDNEIRRLFGSALPYAQKAEEIEPNNKEVLTMLSGIYFGLDKMELKKKVDQKLKELD